MRAAKATLTSQLSLFSALDAPSVATAVETPRGQRTADAKPRLERRAKREPAICTVVIEDLPTYPSELVEGVDQVIGALPPARMWFTYRDIAVSFGVSRATTARRVKEGLVPGVRIQSGRVLEDGAVRRFDRTQLRWLLLAVRSGGRLSNAHVRGR